MNRTIKFRAWDKEDKTITYFDFFDYTGFLYDLYSAEQWNEKDKYIFQQFTGLIDKNGKEVYEGDIIKYNEYSNYGIRKMTEVVKFLDGGFQPFCECDFYVKNYKIIGNIYGNPEFLKIKK